MPRAGLKRKINLTVAENRSEKAKQVAEQRGESLSQLVEDFLATIVAESFDGPLSSAIISKANWLGNFHRRYLRSDFQEPTDRQIDQIKQMRVKRYR